MKNEIVQAAQELGFSLCRVTTAEPLSCEYLAHWLDRGCHGDMRYMARNPEKRCDPKSLLPEARSVICCALAYGDEGINSGLSLPLTAYRLPLTGFTARFARGADYHVVVREKLDQLVGVIRKRHPNAKTKCCVDTSPLLEKALAVRAGIGWMGKHTLLVNPAFGSWFVLGEIITDLELQPDAPMRSQCYTCSACLEGCPTRALAAYELDARRCISYLTIECKDAQVREKYGCDRCQEVCPFNISSDAS